MGSRLELTHFAGSGLWGLRSRAELFCFVKLCIFWTTTVFRVKFCPWKLGSKWGNRSGDKKWSGIMSSVLWSLVLLVDAGCFLDTTLIVRMWVLVANLVCAWVSRGRRASFSRVACRFLVRSLAFFAVSHRCACPDDVAIVGRSYRAVVWFLAVGSLVNLSVLVSRVSKDVTAVMHTLACSSSRVAKRDGSSLLMSIRRRPEDASMSRRSVF